MCPLHLYCFSKVPFDKLPCVLRHYRQFSDQSNNSISSLMNQYTKNYIFLFFIDVMIGTVKIAQKSYCINFLKQSPAYPWIMKILLVG